MAKDFDFLPNKRTPQSPTTKVKPARQPRPQTAQKTKAPMRTGSNATPGVRRVHKMRSKLINYDPLTVASAAQLGPKPNLSKSKATPIASRTSPVPPYFPPARTAPPARSQVDLVAKRFDKKTIMSVLVSFVAVVLLASGLLIPLLENPSVTIILYIIAAIIFKLSSKVSFSIALLLLLAIPILLLIGKSTLAGTYAIFCFYFLVVGTISATIEFRKSDN